MCDKADVNASSNGRKSGEISNKIALERRAIRQLIVERARNQFYIAFL